MEAGKGMAAVGVLLCLVTASMAMGTVTAVESKPAGNQDASVTIEQAKDILMQVWEVASPWVQWLKQKWQQVLSIVWEKASLQGVRNVATEASRVGLDAATGHPYQAAYKVARNVPVAGEQVKNVIGEVRLREKARQEEAADHSEL